MNFAAIIDRLDDRINPIVVKELRQAVKSRVVIVLLLVYLSVQLFIVGTALLFRQAGSVAGDGDWTAGRDVFVWIQGVLAFTLILLVPAYACIRLAAERSDQNVDLLFISTLKPHSIISGKFFAAFMLGVLIFSCCAPFMTFMYLLRGLDIPTILYILTIDLLALLFATMFAMLLASIPGGLVVKVVVLFLGYVFYLIPVCIYTIAGCTMLVEFASIDWDSPAFWAATSTSMAAVLGSIGLMFTYSTALISPASSNRLLIVRLYVLGAWLAGVVGMVIGGRYLSGEPWVVAVILWIIAMAIMLGMQLTISISERDHYGPRLQRQIPSNLLFRVPAFFLYTGAVNGIVFTLTLCILTMGLGGFWLDRALTSMLMAPGAASGSENSVTFQVCTVILLYLYNYGLTAVLFRVYLFGGAIRPGFTWLIQGLLIGLGSSMPAILAFVFFQDQLNAGNDAMWWKLPSPFMSAFSVANDFPRGTVNQDYLEVCLWFLGIWAVLVSLLAMPWAMRQLTSFRPRVAAQVVEAQLVEEPAAPADATAAAPASNGVVTEVPPAAGVQAR